MKDLKFTHAYGNRYDWPNYELVESMGMKVFVNIRGDIEELTEQKIRNVVLGYENQKGKWVTGWKDRPGCGGYWCDQLGHEPDITNPPMEGRKWFYEIVRKYDSDIVNHPVMEMFDQDPQLVVDEADSVMNTEVAPISFDEIIKDRTIFESEFLVQCVILVNHYKL